MIYRYDGASDRCPVPLVQTRLLLKKMDKTDSCIVILKDSGSTRDIPKYLTEKGYYFTSTTHDDGCVELHITIGK